MSSIKTLIDAYIKRNANQEITGPVLNGVLTAIADALGTPFIGEDGYWYEYDQETGEYVSSGTPAQGESGVNDAWAAVGVSPDPQPLPSVDVNYNPTLRQLGFTFYDIQGPKGDQGTPGITGASVSVDANVGTPSVDASIVNSILTLAFHNLRGAAAGFGTPTISVGANQGTPSASVTASGPDTAKVFHFAFDGLKGETGPQGPQGPQGNTGANVDYPYELVNNLETNDPTKGLSAAMGVQLEGEVSQLSQEVTNNADNIDNLQQEIDAIQPIVIEGNVTNAPDQEDITTDSNNLLKFANRPTAVNQMGHKILRKGATFSSQVTDTNTIYEIRYDFDLNNATVTIPAGCVLKFVGGKLSNGTVTGNNTSIEAGDNQIFSGVSFAGTWVGDLNACWVGAKKNDNTFDNSPILQTWLNTYGEYFKNITFPTARYYFLSTAILSTDKRRRHIIGNNSDFYVNISTDGASFLELNGGEQFSIRDVTIINNRTTGGYNISKNTAIHFKKTHNFSMQGVSFYYFDIAVRFSDVWYGGIYGKNLFWQNRIAIYLESITSSEVNTIDFNNPRITGCSIDAARAVCPQDAGESSDDYAMRSARCGVDVHCQTHGVKYNGLVIEGCDYGIRYNYVAAASDTAGASQLTIEKCFFEGNASEDIYIGRGYVYDPNSLGHVKKMNEVALIISGCCFDITANNNIYLMNCSSHIIGCTRNTKAYCTNDSGKTCCIYDEYINMTSVPLSADIYIREGQIPDYPSSTGGVFASTMRQFLGNARVASLIGALLPNNTSGIDANVYYSSGTAVPRYLPRVNSAYDAPTIKVQAGINPNDMEFRDGVYRTFVRSGNGVVGVTCTPSQYFPCVYSFRNDGIELHEFLRRWKAGTAYTGFVNQVFPFEVRAVPSEGKLYMKDHTDTEKLIGIGKTAIDAGFSFSTGYYIIVESLTYIFFAYSVPQFMADMVQCGRDYKEFGVSGGSTAEYNKRRFIGTTTQRDAIRPRFNATFYNTTTKKFEINNGFNWVEMTDPFKRFIFAEEGKSLSLRATVPDLPNQKYFNAATGITYRYVVSADLWTGNWIGGIGNVASLDHPNGYDATSNPLDYATELSAGEVVQYAGAFYKWAGTQFVAL